MSATKQEIAKSNGKSGGELANIKNEVLDSVERRVGQLTDGGMLHLPPNYSAANALKAAWLVLQEAKSSKQSGEKPVLEYCTRVSIANSLFSMVVQGLDPNRNQCYFIAHGKTLTLRRSYFGTLAIGKRVAKVRDVYAEVVYEGDDFEFETRRGIKTVTKHVQSLESMGGQIVGAYAVVEFTDEDMKPTTEIMTWADIQKAWSKGGDKNKARDEFPGEMAKRTVINRALKRHINSSDDEHLALLLEHVNRSDVEAAHEEVDAEAAEHGNQQYIDVEVDNGDEQLALEEEHVEEEQESVEVEAAPEDDGDGRLFEKPAPRSAVQPPF